MCVWGGRKQTTKPPCMHVCQGIIFHANSARARANPTPNTPAGWSRVAWFGFEDEVVVLVEVPPVVVVVGRVPVVVPVESEKSFQHRCARTPDNEYHLPEDVVFELAVCHGRFKNCPR